MHILSVFYLCSKFVNHFGKNEPVDRIHQIPIDDSKQTLGCKENSLHKTREIVFDRFSLKLQPTISRQLHFCFQSYHFIWFDLDDPKEINCVSQFNIACFWPTFPHPNTTNNSVYRSTQTPC
jgi:hypothetical protein